MSAEDKKIRGTKKASVTRATKGIERYITEENEGKLKESIDRAMRAFEEFEHAHDIYHDALEDDEIVEESELYYNGVHNDYITKLKEAKNWLHTRGRDAEVKEANQSNLMQSQQEMMSVMNLPKVELEAYDGNPLTYHSFIAMFDEVVHHTKCESRAKLTRLLQYTKGKAKDAIRSCILLEGDDAYKQARETLKARFGNDHLVTERIIQNLRNGKNVKSPDDLQCLADDLRNCEKALSQMGTLPEVDSQTCILEVVNRLESYLQFRWKRHAIEVKRNTRAYPKFKEFVKFICDEAEEATDPVYSCIGGKPKQVQKSVMKMTSSFSSSTSVSSGNLKRSPRKCLLCSNDHKLLYCPEFRRMTVEARSKIVADKRLCCVCLLDNHKTANCRKEYRCTISGCGERHSKFLHVTMPGSDANNINLLVNADSSTNQVSGVDPEIKNDLGCNASQIVNANVSNGMSIHLPVVPVKINDSVIINALLDTGSSNTFCTTKLVNQLGLSCNSTRCHLSTLHGSDERLAKVAKFKVASVDGHNMLNMCNVLVVEKIPVQTNHLDVVAYLHLSDLPIVAANEAVDLLIGQDYSEALIPLEVRKGNRNEPFAVRTLLGWSVNGPSRLIENVSPSAISNFVSVSLEKRVEDLWNIENENMSADELSWSKSDREVISLWEKSIVRVNGHYQLPIPWKSGAYIPNNLAMARSRLKSLYASLNRKGLFLQYDAEIQKLLSEGYAELIDSDLIDRPDKVWYLPHHAIISDKKPGKVRIVFDCAAKVNGESLNDKCHQGPDLCNKLLHVLLRFRQHNIAIISDVQAMYYQVLIPPDDRDVLRFLWFDKNGQIIHFRMTRHVFGGVWCSASSTFALRRALSETLNPHPLVVDTILRSFYVDDCLRSVSSAEEGHIVIQGTRSVLSEGGFKLTKFTVNDVSLLTSIPVEDRAQDVGDVEFVKDSKVLGVKWCVSDDYFYFDINLSALQAITKRSILSIVSSMYDPLGLISPIVLIGRLIFQEVTRLKLDWDQPVSHHIERKWKDWIQGLGDLNAIRFPRCVMPGDSSDMVLEIHNFSDASTLAYGFCSYIRAIDRQGAIHTCLLIAKSRVAPLKSVTIPRLELQAAVMAAQANALLVKELDFEITRSYFWTDSRIVLGYIFNESRRFHMFVSNRLSQIHQLTSVNEWFHVPGNQNPADVVSRGTSAKDFDLDLWIKGPQFLRSYKCDWDLPEFDPSIPASDPEVKVTSHVVAVNDAEHPLDRLSRHYSSWYRLKRAVAWFLRLKDILKQRMYVKDLDLSLQEMHNAESVVVKYVQHKSYGKEITCLSNGSAISKSSSLIALNPVLDAEGRLVVGGRLKHAVIPERCKHPYVIPFDHIAARLIIQEEHDKAHLGVEWVIANVRKKFWITKIRRLAKGIAHRCIKCRRLFAAPSNQKMADHISERLEAGNSPFTYTGTDCFGPFLVKQGRSQVKRYGCIFTCLNTRAVHIEVLHSLDTDSFINGFRRFVSRRGLPAAIWSDNGTNIAGSNNELKNAMSQIKSSVLQNFGAKVEVEWHFNPPHASHKGGLWERVIRTIRKVLAGLSSINTVMTDETLVTLLCEVEAIINGRPITKASEDVNDLSALTPNHLLLLKEHPNLSPGQFGHVDIYKRRWRCVQHLAQEFWRRWLREYLPELQKRQKWMSDKRNLKIGDLVLIVEENTPRGVWPIGLVQEVSSSSDGLIRSVTVKTRSTSLVRPVTKVVFLEGSMV